MRLASIVLFVLAVSLAGVAEARVGSRVQVQDDATLKINGKIVHLFGIYVPKNGKVCEDRVRPVTCGSRAAQALRFRIRTVVFCDQVSRNRDGSRTAVCHIDRRGEIFDPSSDLSAHLLQRGLAVASPGAPFEYRILEEIARSQGRGIWGFFADSIR